VDKTLWQVQGTPRVWLLGAAAALALVIGGLVACRQLEPGSTTIGSGPGLLYFYADW